jgi:diguanylate cyclase (GGDEF)-like protein
MTRRRRAIYRALRLAVFVASLIAVALAAASTFPKLRIGDALVLVVSLSFFIILRRIDAAATVAWAHGKRRTVDVGRFGLELPVLITILTIYGPAAAAMLELCGYPLAITADSRSRLWRRLLDGAANAGVWMCLGAVRAALLPAPPGVSAHAYLNFLAFYVVAIFASLFLVWTPLKTFVGEAPLLSLWRNLLRDTRIFAYTLLLISWAYVCTIVWLRAGTALGVTTFLPLAFIASAMRAIYQQRGELHRMRLARDAVQAMLRTNDPLPQMNSLLASLHTPAAEETLQIYAVFSPQGAPATLATIGPIPDQEQLNAVRRALAELQHSDRASTSHRWNRMSLTAHAVRSADDELLGALVVHRSARTSSLLTARRLAQATSELSPLLRDFRAIAATQTAARVDALTGLPNRRTILELLRDKIDDASTERPCAVLLIDIDHFKNINDTMGHQAGDRCLRTVAAVIARNIRNMDRPGRIGGEEFVILMPDTSSDLARSVGERLRAAIQNAGMQHTNGEPLTASIGVAVAALHDSVESILERADKALYQAKRQGRNRVVEISA